MILHYLSMMIFFKVDRFILPLLMILTKLLIKSGMVIHKWCVKASSTLQQRIYCSQNKLHKEGVSGAVEEKCMERERGQRWFCILGAAEKRVDRWIQHMLLPLLIWIRILRRQQCKNVICLQNEFFLVIILHKWIISNL